MLTSQRVDITRGDTPQRSGFTAAAVPEASGSQTGGR